MKVSSRLVVAGFAVFFGLALIAGYTLIKLREDALSAHRERIKNLVEVTRGVVGHYQQLEAEKKLSREEAQFQAKEALRKPRFGSDDYYFLYDFDGRALMVAGSPGIEGQIMLGKTDKKDFRLWDAFVAIGKGPGSGYVEYWFPRAGQTEPKPKLAYLVSIPAWQWIVGTGVYIDDVDEAVFKAALQYSLLSLIVLAVVSAISLLVSRSIVSQLGGEPHDAAECMSRIANGDLNIKIPLKSNDTSSLMASLKLMQMKLTNLTSAILDDSSSLTDQVRGFDSAARSYGETRTEEGLATLLRSAKKLGKTASILAESISRFKL